jgi:hypothetical protein
MGIGRTEIEEGCDGLADAEIEVIGLFEFRRKVGATS